MIDLFGSGVQGYITLALVSVTGSAWLCWLVSCFVMAQNVSYRGIYLLFVLPALVAYWRGAAWLILLLMWNSALRPGIDAMAEWSSPAGIRTGFWLVHELAWWDVITLLTTLLLRLVRDSPAVAALPGRSVPAAHYRPK